MEGLGSFISSLLLISAGLVTFSVATETVVPAHIGDTVELPCRVNVQHCGQLHSVKWYKDANRVYVLSHAGKGRAEGDATERMEVEYTTNSAQALLKISPVVVEDEATYKCEITYLEVIENCDVVQIVKLRTLKKPDAVRIIDKDGVPINSTKTLGPKKENEQIELICEAIGGKPTPKVKWYNGTTELKNAEYTAIEDGEGFGTGRSKLPLILSRGDLMARFECRVESDALDEPIISWIKIDVHVRPLKLDLTGNNRVVQGTNVLLLCNVVGARPAAVVRWVNGTQPITNDSLIETSPEDNFRIITTVTEERDGTYTTKSSLSFKATHWENEKTIYCYATNKVIDDNQDPELLGHILLDVKYPPIITINPLNTTVNETNPLAADPTTILLQCSYDANPSKLKGIVWSKDGTNLTLNDSSKYVGGTIDTPSLFINNVTRDDMGNYTCTLKNEVGSETSKDEIYVNVQYPPDVEVIMDPSTPIKATERGSVLLLCNVTSGNPLNLSKVRWFLDGELMKEFPECNYTYNEKGDVEGSGGPFCGLDPSILSLEKVDETFSGTYTCQGKNVAGWGQVSDQKELVVHYPPSPAKLRYYPSSIIKGGSVNLECTVDSPGRPDNVTYLWYRGSHQMAEITTYNFTISPVRLETRSNFTCIAVNEGGQSEPATVYINVNAPPAFIQPLLTYQGVLYSSEYINLTCIVECYPLCSIIWKKDGVEIKNSTSLYKIQTQKLEPDLRKNDFESINSTLIWNMEAWPEKKLDKSSPNANYTCQSMGNTIGEGVSSTIEIAVDYPPDELTVSSRLVSVIENQDPSPVKCQGKGHPALSYRWKKNATSEPISDNEELHLPPLNRKETGSYICEASNKHGTQTAVVVFNVQYAPECNIMKAEKDSRHVLVCTANANPQNVTFTWKVREGNDTFVESSNIEQDGVRSYLFLDSSVDTRRTYICEVNNTVGSSTCDIDVSGNRPWWMDINKDKLILIIGAVVAIIIIVIIICIIIIIMCRRKRADTKSPNPSSIEDKARLGAAPPVGGTADPLNDPDKGFYENLPFHGMQNPPNKPYRPDPCDLDYADVDYKSYGPINYKAASIYAAMKRNKNNNKMEEMNKDDLL